ncbi:MAG: SRPBCC domain-containing protein, partial [Sphingomonadaceae bacterium]|nr:SRPBCC domain-containing protein [Sphingomonadaceae bacterium]
DGDGTRYTALCRHWTEADCKRHEEMGFIDGWGACADQLVELCEK